MYLSSLFHCLDVIFLNSNRRQRCVCYRTNSIPKTSGDVYSFVTDNQFCVHIYIYCLLLRFNMKYVFDLKRRLKVNTSMQVYIGKVDMNQFEIHDYMEEIYLFD